MGRVRHMHLERTGIWEAGSPGNLPTMETAVNFIDNVPHGGNTVLVLENG